MPELRKTNALAGAALAFLMLFGLLPGSTGFALAAPPEALERPPQALVPLAPGLMGLRGLREAPDIPVDSIILRRAFPDHPIGPQQGRGAPFPGQEPAGEAPSAPDPQTGACGDEIDLDAAGDISGVKSVAAQDNGNGTCTNADIDTYVSADGTTYVVQAGGQQAAWTLTDVSDPADPFKFTTVCWSVDGVSCDPFTYTPDVKAFNQGGNDYIVMGLERPFGSFGFCGVIIVNVTDPNEIVLESQFFVGSGNPRNRWCDVHNVFVEKDAATGAGKYIYVTADATNDLRVLDISGTQGGSIASPKEIGRYTAPTANNSNYVHDVTVLDHGGAAGRRVYLAYWNTGLVILDAADVTPGTNPIPIVGPNAIDPSGFLTHHAWASQDGSLVFIQDEFLNADGDEPVQMWDVSNPASPGHVDGLALGADVPVNPAHNLEIRDDINPNRLYVAWYKLGLRAWDFDANGFSPSALHHKVQVAGGVYEGAWGVRLAPITPPVPAGQPQPTGVYVFQSDRGYGLIIDCLDEDAAAGCDQIVTHDVAVTDVRAFPDPPVLAGAMVLVEVDVENLTDIADEVVDVTLTDATDGVVIGTQPTNLDAAPAPMSVQTLNFDWTVPAGASIGDHDLVATATLVNDPDSNLSNNSGSVVVTIDSPDPPPGGTAPTVSSCEPSSGNAGDRITVTVAGTNFQDGATADFGERIVVQGVTFLGATSLEVRIKVHRRAASGPRDVIVTNPDGTSGTGLDCFTVN